MMMRHRVAGWGTVVLVATLMGAPGCSSPNAKDGAAAVEGPDQDGDALPDRVEDRNQNGRVDPGETDPNQSDSDADGIADIDEVASQACAVQNDRPFFVFDVPGANSYLLADAQVQTQSMLRTPQGQAPGAVFWDSNLQVGAVIVGKAPYPGVDTPTEERDLIRGQIFQSFGQILSQRARTFATVQGFVAEQASFRIDLNAPTDAASMVNDLARSFTQETELSGLLALTGAGASEATVNLLTVQRSAQQYVVVAAVAMGRPPADAALLRVEELTDGTNVARRDSFTRHVCDQFETQVVNKADILWVVDDSGSMADDQMAVRAAADAMGDVLARAEVDYRLAVSRMRAREGETAGQRGRLEGGGFTQDLEQFQDDIIVGARGGWEPGLQTGLLALSGARPATAPDVAADARKLREDAATIVIFLSDERDQTVECAACGECDAQEGEPLFCEAPAGQPVVEGFAMEYLAEEAVVFALVGDLPNGCSQGSDRDDFEPGQGYVEVANATGGQFGSLCGDMRQNLEDVARATTGVASTYQLSAPPASATLKVAVGPPGQGRVIPRSRQNGFDYDPVANKIVFYGDARPQPGDEIAVAYRRWDWAGRPGRPGDPCDMCPGASVCDPVLDIAECSVPCAGQTCADGTVCLPETAMCGTPGDPGMNPEPVPGDRGCECQTGLVCDPSANACVAPCEETGCAAPEICNQVTHLCRIPGV